MNLYSFFVRPALDILSGFDRERAHYLAIFALKLFCLPVIRSVLTRATHVKNERTVFGVTFPNPVGAAAGFDKYAAALHGIEALGFGFVEVGTVTRLPQQGNPRPRLFRLDEDSAVINRMGFNNDGAEALAQQLARYRELRIPVGINVGKGRDTPLERAADDYCACIKILYAYADYFTLNISSPNTKDLRRLHESAYLGALLDAVQETVRECAKGERPKPVLLKLSPDLNNSELDSVLETARSRVQGLVTCNTTTERPESLRSSARSEIGGLSGIPLQARALELVRTIHAKLPDMPIIGVGGIFTPDDAKRMFEAGASLIQVYSGLVFEGPFLAKRINEALHGKL